MNTSVWKKVVAPTVLLAIGTGCGSSTWGVGELGRVGYSLHSDFVAEEGRLDELDIVTGHRQLIRTYLTEKGENAAGEDEASITHGVSPETPDVQVVVYEDDNEVPDFDITALAEGAYTLESRLDGDVFDYITLSFATPNEMEMVSWVLPPDAEDWVDLSGGGPHAVAVGTQATFLPIPSRDGQRLVGDIAVELLADPEDAVVQGENVLAVYEQNVVTTRSPVSLFFVETGDVTITLEDQANQLAVEVAFVVE